MAQHPSAWQSQSGSPIQPTPQPTTPISSLSQSPIGSPLSSSNSQNSSSDSKDSPPANTAPIHPMVTRSKRGVTKPVQRLNLHTTLHLPVPRSYKQALQNPKWQKAMRDEYNAFIKNVT